MPVEITLCHNGLMTERFGYNVSKQGNTCPGICLRGSFYPGLVEEKINKYKHILDKFRLEIMKYYEFVLCCV